MGPPPRAPEEEFLHFREEFLHRLFSPESAIYGYTRLGPTAVPSCGRTNFVHVFAKSPADRLQLSNDRTLKAPPQSNKVCVPQVVPE